MTDKQKIIDGIDVSGCIHYEEYFEEDEDIKIKDFCALWYNSCRSSNNHTCYYKQLKRKEQECEELKQWKKGAESLFKAQINNTDKIINRYKQALTEIKEIAEEDFNHTCWKTYAEQLEQILQKISECEVME